MRPTGIVTDTEAPLACIRFANVEIDFEGHRLTRDGVEQPLEPKTFAVLALLARQPGHVFTRHEILDAVWGHTHVTPSALNRIATLLRQALGENAQQPRWLHTVHGVGYRLDLPADAQRGSPLQTQPSSPTMSEAVSTADSVAGTAASTSAAPALEVGVPSRTIRPMWTWILAVALIGLAAAWIPWVRQAPVAPSSSIEAERLAAPVSVAVLPLANTSGDASQQFFSDGLSGSLIDALSKFDGIRVIGRMSSFRFRDSQDDSKAIGAQLGVAYLISGTVQHAGDAVRIGIELSSTADGRTVWAEHFDRPYTNLFALQDEITRAVAAELPVHLTASGRSPPLDDRPASGSIEAYSAYLQGWKYWHDENFRTAARYLGEAVKLDPDYAMAWAQLSGSWSTVARFSNEAPEQAAEHMRLAREAADHALRLAPALGAAHAAHAYLAFYDFDFHQATTACLRAVQLSPNDSMVLNGCSFTLTGSGQLGQSLQLRDRLRSIEPMYAVNNFAYSALLAMVGRLDEAEKALRLAEELAQAAPLDHLQLALLRGDAAAATAIAERLPTASRMLFTTLAAQIGPDQAMADQALDSLLADQAGLERLGSGGSNEDGFYVVAQIQALRGDLDQTLKWLKRSLASAPSRALFLLDDAFILRFRDDARFIAFCQELGLPPPSDSEALSLDQIRARAKHATVNAAHEPRAGHNHESVKTTPQ